MQQAEMEMVRHQEANLTALAAIGPRKKRKIEDTAQVWPVLVDTDEIICSDLVVRATVQSTTYRMSLRPGRLVAVVRAQAVEQVPAQPEHQ